MKQKILFFITAIAFCAGFAANAQDVDGISLWDKYTKEQLIKKYGKPIKYFSQEDNEVFDGMIEEFVFDDLSIRLDANNVTEFGIESSKPRALTKTINGGIRIGDPENVLKQLERYLDERTVLDDGSINYRFYFGDSTFTILIKNGKINHMYACALTT